MAIKDIVTPYNYIWSFGGGSKRIEGRDGYSSWDVLIFFRDNATSEAKSIGTAASNPRVQWDANILTKCAYSWNFDDGTGSVSLERNARFLTEANGSPGPVPNFSGGGVSYFQIMAQNGQVTNSGHVAHIAYYSRKLTDEQLVALTA